MCDLPQTVWLETKRSGLRTEQTSEKQTCLLYFHPQLYHHETWFSLSCNSFDTIPTFIQDFNTQRGLNNYEMMILLFLLRFLNHWYSSSLLLLVTIDNTENNNQKHPVEVVWRLYILPKQEISHLKENSKNFILYVM